MNTDSLEQGLSVSLTVSFCFLSSAPAFSLLSNAGKTFPAQGGPGKAAGDPDSHAVSPQLIPALNPFWGWVTEPRPAAGDAGDSSTGKCKAKSLSRAAGDPGCLCSGLIIQPFPLPPMQRGVERLCWGILHCLSLLRQPWPLRKGAELSGCLLASHPPVLRAAGPIRGCSSPTEGCQYLVRLQPQCIWHSWCNVK